MKTNIINSFHTMLCLIGALLVISLTSPLVMAETVVSKVESLGEMKYLKVTDLRATQRNGLLNVQAEITNENSSNEHLFYRLKWLDNTGFSVWGEEPWKPVLIYGKQKYLITVVAPTPAATDFRIQLQSPNNTTSGSLNSTSDHN